MYCWVKPEVDRGLEKPVGLSHKLSITLLPIETLLGFHCVGVSCQPTVAFFFFFNLQLFVNNVWAIWAAVKFHRSTRKEQPCIPGCFYVFSCLDENMNECTNSSLMYPCIHSFIHEWIMQEANRSEDRNMSYTVLTLPPTVQNSTLPNPFEQQWVCTWSKA